MEKNYTNLNGLIFDGFPRNMAQVDFFKKKFDISKGLVANLMLNEDVLVEKLLGRRVCSDCGRNYNVCSIHRNGYEMEPLLPKNERTCDSCGGKNLI